MWSMLIVGAVIVGGVGLYNSLVKLREQADAAWAHIDVQLKRRTDLGSMTGRVGSAMTSQPRSSGGSGFSGGGGFRGGGVGGGGGWGVLGLGTDTDDDNATTERQGLPGLRRPHRPFVAAPGRGRHTAGSRRRRSEQ